MIDRHKHSGSGDPDFASAQATPTGLSTDETSEQESARTGRATPWFGRWRQPVRRWFGSRAPAPRVAVDDLAQEVFLRLLRYSDDVAVKNPQGYLFRIAANVANEWRDRTRSRQPHERSWVDELQVDPSEPADSRFFQSRINKHLQGAVSRLPRRQREVLLLHVNDGLTYKQIAERLGVTSQAVLRDLTSAYGALRLQLKAEDL